MPRPRRLWLNLLPFAGCRSFKRISSLLDLQHVANLVDHAAILGRVFDLDGLVPITQAETLRALRMPRRTAETAPKERQPDVLAAAFSLSHVSNPQPKISSTVLPRFAAICAGERIAASAFIVARTTLIGLREP